jgi:hypothetical protein
MLSVVGDIGQHKEVLIDACRKAGWDGLPDHRCYILQVRSSNSPNYREEKSGYWKCYLALRKRTPGLTPPEPESTLFVEQALELGTVVGSRGMSVAVWHTSLSPCTSSGGSTLDLSS